MIHKKNHITIDSKHIQIRPHNAQKRTKIRYKICNTNNKIYQKYKLKKYIL